MRRVLRWIGRALFGVVNLVLGLVALAGIAVYVLTSTDWGRERVRRFTLAQLNKVVHGQVSIGRIEGNLLEGATVHDFSIRDTAGNPFLAADEVTASYSIRDLLRRRIWLSDVRVVRPLVVIDKQPGRPWNYQNVFPRDTTPKPPQPPGFGSWIKFERVTVVGGQLIVRTPWAPGDELTPTERDSVLRDAREGRSRIAVVRAENAAPRQPPYQKVVDLRAVDATLPLLRITDPAYHSRYGQVTSLRMTALPFRPPAATVTALRGSFEFNDDSVWWRGAHVSLPASRVSGDGSYVIDSGDMTLELHGAPAALADLRWLYPRLPSVGQGTLNFVLRWRGETEEYIATDATVASGRARIGGSFGLTLGDTFALHGTNLRFSDFDTRLVEQLFPTIRSPRRGELTGRLAINGGKHALRVDGDVGFADALDGTSRVIALGEAGMLGGAAGGMRAKGLHVELRPLQVGLAKAAAVSVTPAAGNLPFGGVLTGNVVVDGTTRSQLAVAGELTHADRGLLSRIGGTAAVRMPRAAQPLWMDINVAARPVALAELGPYAPAVGLHGEIVGPIRVVGDASDLAVNADLRLNRRGQITARGRLDLVSSEMGYDLNVRVRDVNLHGVLDSVPATAITITASAVGRGVDPATMRATLSADISTSAWDRFVLDSASLRASVADGLAQVQHLLVSAARTSAEVSGAFGLVATRTGTLAYRASTDSIGALDRLFPHTGADTGVVRPRPGAIVRALRRARADSARIARETEVERAVTGRPMPRLVVDTPQAVARVLSGAAYAAGTVSGNIQRFDIRGRLAAESLDVHGNSATRLRAEYAWTGARTPASTIALAFQGDTITVKGFAFDSIDARLIHRSEGGRVEVLVRQGDQRQYGLRGDYVLGAEERTLKVRELRLAFDSTTWTETGPATLRWRTADGAIEVQHLELQNGRNGRIYANGLLPAGGAATLDVAVDNFEVGDLFALLQSDIGLHGMATMHVSVRGTSTAPTFNGAFGLAAVSYNTAPLPDLRGTVGYSNRLLEARLEALRPTTTAPAPVITHAEGRVPVNLALSGVTGGRLLDAPLVLDIAADSLPLEVIPQLTDLVTDVRGYATARVSVRGTAMHPSLAGGVLLRNGQVGLASTGVVITDLFGTVRLRHDSVYIDSLVGRSRGSLRISGTLGVHEWREPSFDLAFSAKNAEVLRNFFGRIRADADLQLRGPFAKATLTGKATVTQGVIYGPKTLGRHVIGANDPHLFNVVDTTAAIGRVLFPAESPLLKDLSADVKLSVARGTWVRAADANVEIYTDYPLEVHVEQSAFTLTGTVNADRGEYGFLGKRFQIANGSATFVGTPDLNPTIQATGQYQVQAPNSPALSIQVVVGGTLRQPKLSLQSDAQPPRSQSELLSLLAFGQSTTSLIHAGGNTTSLATVGAPGDLVGLGATLAARRLTGMAVGVLANELENEAGRAVGADQFNITPGDLAELSSLASQTSWQTFLNSTRIEAVKYVNPRTFVSVQEYSGYPGARIEYRGRGGWQYSTFLEPRVQLEQPTLASQPFVTFSSFGVFILREWRY